MESIESNWQLIWDPTSANVTFLDFGQEIASELEPQLTKGLEVAPIIEGVPFLRATGADVYQIALRVFVDKVDDKTSRAEVLQSLVTVAGYGVKPLRMKVRENSTHYWQFASAFITGHTAARHMTDVNGQARLVRTFNITGVSLTRVTV
ncbi:MAG: hypothetical protein EOP87_00920 [Verrucomicrobiaceae bacterium]|nr:MAG: hypothetical protein EOP87_00920 [Verrucomicrobiaceae bacterium]